MNFQIGVLGSRATLKPCPSNCPADSLSWSVSIKHVWTGSTEDPVTWLNSHSIQSFEHCTIKIRVYLWCIMHISLEAVLSLRLWQWLGSIPQNCAVCCRVFVSGQIKTNGTTTSNLKQQQQQQQQQRQLQRASLAPTHFSSSSSVAAAAAAAAHPAPLFLRHVVNRRFKYRWLVLALSGFTCMSIIVILSVVYSNWSLTCTLFCYS